MRDLLLAHPVVPLPLLSKPRLRFIGGLFLERSHGQRVSLPKRPLLRLYQPRWLPSAFAGRQDGGCLSLRPVEAHDEVDRVIWRGKPVSFFVGAGTVFLDVERER